MCLIYPTLRYTVDMRDVFILHVYVFKMWYMKKPWKILVIVNLGLIEVVSWEYVKWLIPVDVFWFAVQWTDCDMGQVAGFQEPTQADVFITDCGGPLQGIQTSQKVHCKSACLLFTLIGHKMTPNNNTWHPRGNQCLWISLVTLNLEFRKV